MFGFWHKNRAPRVLLAAIARDEAAYLPEWIFHHLYFGFDHIQICINRTKDNTQDVVEYFSDNTHVSFINVDELFYDGAVNPQIACYKEVFQRAYDNNFTHVLFIDIDEFWTPNNLINSVHKTIEVSPEADSISFQWCNKLESQSLFSPALEVSTPILRAPQVKSLLKLHKKAPAQMNPHNVSGEGLIRTLADGSRFSGIDERMSRLEEAQRVAPLQPAFILHRIFRSQYEFIASLAKFNPEQQQDTAAPIKSNRRRGYPSDTPDEWIYFDDTAFQHYRAFMQCSLAPLKDITQLSQGYIQLEYERVIKIIENAAPEAERLFSMTLRNITLKEVKHAYEIFLQNIKK